MRLSKSEKLEQPIEAMPEGMTAALHFLVHDMCSPLQSLIASNESLSIQRLDEEGRGAVARIRRATQKLSLQLDDLATLARVQSGDQTSHEVSFEVGALMHEVAAQGNGNLRSVVPAAPIFARGDAVLILQVLDRLVRAVVQGNQSQVTLTVGQVTPQAKGLTFNLQCLELQALPDRLLERLNLVRVLAAALKGDLKVVSCAAAPTLLQLRVPVEIDDPDALAAS